MISDDEWLDTPKAKPRRMMTADVLEFVCQKIEEGQSVREIFACNDLPARSAFYRFVDADKQAQDRYARAMELRQLLLFDQIIDIADTPQLGEKRKVLVSGSQSTDEGQLVEVTEGDMIEHRKLQIEARKWALGKMNPEKYGNRTDLKVDGSLTLDSVAERLARAKERLKDEI